MMIFLLPYLIVMRVHRMAIEARRLDRTWRYLAYSALAGISAGLTISFAVFLGWLMLVVNMPIFAVLITGAIAAPALAPILARHLAIPRGWLRVAHRLGHIGNLGKDGEAYALCLAAWAHSVKPTPAGEAWLLAKRDRRVPLGDAEIIVTALIASGRRDAETARQLLRSVVMMRESHPTVRELAGEWLACDAAERGAWTELAADAAATLFPATPLTFFLEGVAATRIRAPGAPGPMELWLRWVVTPHPPALRFLLAPVPTTTASSPATSHASPVVDAEAAPWPRAIATHLAISETVTSAQLGNAIASWDHALADPATRDWLARRAFELGAPLGAAEKALSHVTTEIADDLAKRAEAGSLGAPPLRGPVADALARRMRHGRLDALETAFTRWAERRPSGVVLPAIDEWREFVALRAAYDAAVVSGGYDLRRLAFPHAYRTGNTMATWLWNTRKEYALSYAISKWLLDEALAVGDTEAIELGHRNCSLDVFTRV